MRYQTTNILRKMPQPHVLPLTHLRTSSILPSSGPPKSWTKIDEDLEARLHSSVFYLEGHMVPDKIATTCGITSAALHMYRITGNSPLDANNGRRSSRRIDVTKHLAGNPMSDKKTNKRLSEDHPNLGVNISQRASGNSLKLITQTKISECLSVPFDGIWFGNLIEEKQMGFEMLSKLVFFFGSQEKRFFRKTKKSVAHSNIGGYPCP